MRSPTLRPLPRRQSMWSRPFKRSLKTPWPRFTNIKSLSCFGIIPMHWSDCPIFFSGDRRRLPRHPRHCATQSAGATQGQLCLLVLVTLSAFIQHTRKCVAYRAHLVCNFTTRSHERLTFCPALDVNEADSDYFAPCLWYKKIFDYILSEEKLWFYVCWWQCSRDRKYSHLYVHALLKST